MFAKVKDCLTIIILGLIAVFIYLFSSKQTKLINQFIEIDKRKDEQIKQIMNKHSKELEQINISYSELFHALEEEHEDRLIELKGNPDKLKEHLINKGFEVYD